MTPDERARRSADAMWASDRASQALGMKITDVRPGIATLEMTVRDDMVNGQDIGHGGLTFTLADSAFAFACNSYNTVTVAAGATIEFLAPGRLGDELTATAQERSRSRRTGIYDIEVRNQKGECVAMFRGRSHEVGGALVGNAAQSADAKSHS